MGWILGMDEAGYGPNLGPLVVTVTVWEVPGHPGKVDFWKAFGDVVDGSASRDESRLSIADSKRVYQSSGRLDALERSVLAALWLSGNRPKSFRDLLRMLTAEKVSSEELEAPWFGDDLSLPRVLDEARFREPAEQWSRLCQQTGISLRGIRSDVVTARRFNELTRRCGNKAAALSHVSLQLLGQVWDPDTTASTRIIADKHGGRNRYDGFLAEAVGERMIFRLEETRQQSRYRVGRSELRFARRAEDHLPVALASLISKYVRELAMLLFNRFWCAHCATLKPTKGYPADARRFKADIGEEQRRLGIPDHLLWRER